MHHVDATFPYHLVGKIVIDQNSRQKQFEAAVDTSLPFTGLLRASGQHENCVPQTAVTFSQTSGYLADAADPRGRKIVGENQDVHPADRVLECSAKVS
jgi:hypothetical protein